MPTQKFKWKDRDTAAQDLLQVAYHAPPSVSRRALSLLGSIRSRSIIPDLEAIVLDESRDIWERRYSLRAITSVSGDLAMPQFAPYMENAFANRCNAFRKIPPHRTYNSDFSPDLLDEFVGLVDEHLLNREWFFEALNRVQEPAVASEFLTKSLHYRLTEDFKQQLLDMLLDLLNQNPNILTLEIVQGLSYDSPDKIRDFLNTQLKSILELCLSSPRDQQWLMLADDWDELRDALIKAKPEVESLIADYRQGWVKKREERKLRNEQDLQLAYESPAYKLLLKLYEAAQNDDKSAYDRLRQIAKRGGDIPLRAVATHFIGQLVPKYDSLIVLQFLVKYADDDWGDYPADSPIRYEAGEALMRHPSSDAWDTLVDAYFIKPRNVLSDFMQDWIAHVTDALSGELHDYQGVHWGDMDDRGWFYALAEIDEKMLAKYTNP